MPLANVITQLHSDVALIWLLTVNDPTGPLVLRAASNLEDVVSRGQRFTAFPFEVTLPPDTGDGRPQSVKVTFPNVGRELMEVIRKYAPDQPPDVKIELVLSDNPDFVEKTIDFLQVVNAEYDPLAVTFTLATTPIFGRKTCLNRYNETEFPGLNWSLR